MTCDDCNGACCRDIHLPIRLDFSPDVWIWIALHGKETWDGVCFEIPCHHLIDGRCAIYDQRPKVCRDFEVGCKHCADARAKYHNSSEEQ